MDAVVHGRRHRAEGNRRRADELVDHVARIGRPRRRACGLPGRVGGLAEVRDAHDARRDVAHGVVDLGVVVRGLVEDALHAHAGERVVQQMPHVGGWIRAIPVRLGGGDQEVPVEWRRIPEAEDVLEVLEVHRAAHQVAVAHGAHLQREALDVGAEGRDRRAHDAALADAVVVGLAGIEQRLQRAGVVHLQLVEIGAHATEAAREHDRVHRALHQALADRVEVAPLGHDVVDEVARVRL